MADVGGAVVHFETAWPLINIEITDNVNFQETLPKAQQTQGIEYFDSFNRSFEQNNRTTLTNPCNNFDKSINTS